MDKVDCLSPDAHSAMERLLVDDADPRAPAPDLATWPGTACWLLLILRLRRLSVAFTIPSASPGRVWA
jgi:hypothetical protein